MFNKFLVCLVKESMEVVLAKSFKRVDVIGGILNLLFIGDTSEIGEVSKIDGREVRV